MNELRIGQIVENFGIKAEVIGFHKITNDPILLDKSGWKWIADASLCKPI